jgi:rhodanese-related sulfurtransferase
MELKNSKLLDDDDKPLLEPELKLPPTIVVLSEIIQVCVHYGSEYLRLYLPGLMKDQVLSTKEAGSKKSSFDDQSKGRFISYFDGVLEDARNAENALKAKNILTSKLILKEEISIFDVIYSLCSSTKKDQNYSVIDPTNVDTGKKALKLIEALFNNAVLIRDGLLKAISHNILKHIKIVRMLAVNDF